MPDINDLRKMRAAEADKMTALADEIAALEDAAEIDAAAVDAKQAEFDAAKAAFDKLGGQIARAEQAEAAQAAAARPPRASETPRQPGAAAPAAPQREEDRGMTAGLFVLALAAGNGDPARAARFAEQKLGASGIAAALNTGTEAAGGVMVPEEYSSDLIKLLKARTVIRRAGARIIDMPAGNLRQARQTGAATAGYGAEAAAIAPSEPTFDKVEKSFKKLTALVPVSNDLVRFGSPSVAQTVRDDMLEQMALREDLAFLRDDGTGDAPKGLRYWAPAGHVFAANATTDLATIGQDLRKMINLVEESNIAMTMPGWIMRPAVKNFLAELRNSVGAKVYPEIDGQGTLYGFPILTTTQIPNNLGAGSDTEITFCDFHEIVIGDAMRIVLSTSDAAAYVSGGTTYSAFQNDLTLMRAISEHDLAPRHDEAISVLTGVDWALAA